MHVRTATRPGIPGAGVVRWSVLAAAVVTGGAVWWSGAITGTAELSAAAPSGSPAPAAKAPAKPAPAAKAPVPPKVLDDRLALDLVAAEPDLVTPTGLAVDPDGNLFVIENHTHHRPGSYKGPPHDIIKVFGDFGPDGRARSITAFHQGFRNGMGLQWQPDAPDSAKGSLLLATRSEIRRLRDTDGDGRADVNELLVRLDTKGDYPHNGLAGFALDPTGGFWFGLGENLGAAYTLVAADGTKHAGGGEGGSVFWCDDRGGKLRRYATGIWNPFHLALDMNGRLWCVDNDPDSRPPCRLLHVVEGGDYGYRFRNGRKGLHPFTSWNGELPGTLPMTAGTAEAPSGVLSYESDGLPADYRGDLLTTSWGDHVIERFTPVARGASWSATARTVVKGGTDFRPVAIVQCPDGSVAFTDWVDKSYPVHGRGRLWRLKAKDRPAGATAPMKPADVLNLDDEALIKLLSHPRAELRAAAAAKLVRILQDKLFDLQSAVEGPDRSRERVEVIRAMGRYFNSSTAERILALGLRRDRPAEALEAARILVGRHPDADDLARSGHIFPATVRAEMLRRFTPESAEDVAVAVKAAAEPDPFLFGAALTALSRVKDATLVTALLDGKQPARTRLLGLLALRNRTDGAGRDRLAGLLVDPDPAIRRAGVQWVGEDNLKQHAGDLEKAVSTPPVTRDVFEAFVAARRFLDGVELVGNDTAGEDVVAALVLDAKRPATLRATALRMLRPDHPKVTAAVLKGLTGLDPALDRAVEATLCSRGDAGSQALLRERAGAEPTADVLAGLAHSATTAETRAVLAAALKSPDPARVREALRSLRGAAGDADTRAALTALEEKSPADPRARAEFRTQLSKAWGAGRQAEALAADAEARPTGADATSPEAWGKVLDAVPGDPEAGRRLFHHPKGPRCYSCHRVEGRGGPAGPDLTTIARAAGRGKLLDSVLNPSREIAPQFTVWSLRRHDETAVTGVLLGDDGTTLTLGDNEGRVLRVKVGDVAERAPQKTSLMPEKLADLMTVQEMRDLLAYLETLK